MGIIASLEVAAATMLLGCSYEASSAPVGSTTLTSSTLSTSELGDDQIASIARRIQANQRALAQLAENRGGAYAVRSLGQRFSDENAQAEVPPPVSTPRSSAVQRELTERDVRTELRLARYGGLSFDRVFLDADSSVLQGDIDVLSRVLIPDATDPALKLRLTGLVRLLSDELYAVRAIIGPEVAH
jgi:hypothetical protein